MGTVCGLLLGLGLLLVWRSGSRAPKLPAPWPRWAVRRTELLRQAGVVGVGSLQLALAQLGCAVVSGMLALVVTGSDAVAGCLALFAAAVPSALLRRLRLRRLAALREHWPDVVDDLASAVRAGMSLAEGLLALAQPGPEQLRRPLSGFAANYRASGRFASCLDVLRDELSDPVADRVCETLRMAHEVGGADLASLLRALSELLRADNRVRAELETRQGWTVNAARLAVAAPWVVLVLLSGRSHTFGAFDTPRGALVLGIGAFACVAAYRTMLRIGRLPEPQRVLAVTYPGSRAGPGAERAPAVSW